MTKAIYAAPGPLPPPARATVPRHEALRRLVSEGVLSAQQADAVQQALRLRPDEVLAAQAGQPHVAPPAVAPPAVAPAVEVPAPTGAAPAPVARPAHRIPWAEITGYLGGGLVLVGAMVLIETSWTQMTELTRTALVTSFAILLLLAGTVAAGGISGLLTARQRSQNARLRVAGALLALGACATAFAVGVALPAGGEGWQAAAASGAGLLVAVAGYALLPTGFGVIAAATLGLYALTSAVDAALVATPFNLGLAWFGFGLLVAALAAGGALRQPQLGLGLGAATTLFGAQMPLWHDGAALWAYLLTLVFAVACLAAYRFARSPVLLVAGVLGMTLAVPEAIWDITNGTVGAAAILLVAGLVLLAASGAGFRLHRRARPDLAD
jgi:hypothetical protein